MKVVRQYIQLENLRHINTPNLHIEIQEAAKSKKIPQYSLIPLIENVFKHAELDDPDQPCILEVKLKEGKLFIHSRNRVREKLKDGVEGIGLDNLEKRLQLLFPEEVVFSKTQTETNFDLTIQFPTK